MEIKLTYTTPDRDVVHTIQKALDCHPVVAGLLADKGIRTADEARFFLNPDYSRLIDPFALKDMDKAVERIHRAVCNKEKILIFGDFDADGVTATAMLHQFLSLVEADLSWYVPHRTKEGYSLQLSHIEMAVSMDVDLIITVDCGISSHEAVQAAALEDIEVIITDHHEPDTIIPKAFAVINPKQSDCNACLEYLAGVGVAFYLIMGLRKVFRDNGVWKQYPEPKLSEYLDLFTIGTIGDMVPLVKDNRTLCVAGMKRIRMGLRPALVSMARTSRVDIGKLDSDDVSFKIVPRLNAAGRISHARICVSHLTCSSPAQTETTAALLDELNSKRRLIEKEIVEDIERRIANDPSLLENRLILLWDSTWEVSVLGIAASRLARKHGCPVILLNSKDSIAKGSCRSINQINIYEVLSEIRGLLETFGGHTMAAGLSVKQENLALLKPALSEILASVCTERDFQSAQRIDAVIEISDITPELVSQIDQLRPFGTGNPEPVFLMENMWVVSSIILGGCHRKMTLKGQSGEQQVEALHFNVSDTTMLPEFFPKLMVKLKADRYKQNRVQVIVQDM
ncbi:single-stranded-DNA-specific exonuclease RecJ [uncultured Desulfobacter sp.]|uniref:single-stranded-DNA-specific exonuclease RecJ n=1 Tax=uncultured Desulfobacter sp. TaxID=240139 RepID=UPI002AAB4F1F|nr:single-stranded-DNA-specific exonuclease RecJ [uncultured Desulfobacter sp.]